MVVGAQAEGVGWARARSQLQWTGELGADPRLGMSAAVAVLMPCSVRHLLRPWTLVRVGIVGPIWANRACSRVRYVARTKCKSVLADLFLYLIVVCSKCKKSLFSWQIPHTEFL